MKAIGYVRVSTDQQADSGAGLAAQESAIRAEVERKGWDLVEIVGEDGGASSATLNRPGLSRALSSLDAGDVDVLVVAKLDRLSRSVIQGSQVIERARRKGWSLVALDFGLDTSTPAGEMVAAVVLSASQYERRMIGVRTRDALAVKRQQGVRLGRPAVALSDATERIVRARAVGQSFREIADALNADGVLTRRGASWSASSVRAAALSDSGRQLAATL